VSAKPTPKPSLRDPEPETPSRGRADLARLRAVTEGEIERTSPAELADLPADFWATAVPVVPGPKTPISLRVDDDVLAWYRESGPRYQSRMNAVLRAYMEHATRGRPARTRRRRPDG
jgi:uncharacterized protein (DUF4415 family)